MRLLLQLFAFWMVLCSSVRADDRAWTYFFFIHGDRDYSGPTYVGDRMRIEEQSLKLFQEIQAVAKADSRNHYVIFHNPKGEPAWYNSRAPKLAIYRKGTRLQAQAWKKSTDSMQPEVWRQIVSEARKALGSDLTESFKMLYFYGEHVSSEKRVAYDVKFPKNGLNLDDFRRNLEELRSLGKFDLFILQSCFMNTVPFLKQLPDFFETVAVPIAAVANAAPDLSGALRQSLNPKALLSELETALNRGARPIPLVRYDQRIREFLTLLDASERTIDSRSLSQETLGQVVHLPESEELLVPIQTYLELLYRLGLPEQTLSRLEALIPPDSTLAQVLRI